MILPVPLRVVHFTDTPRMGGAERHLLSLLECERRSGHRVAVISPQRFVLDAVASAVPEAERIQAGDRNYNDAATARARAIAMGHGFLGLRSVLRRRSADLLHVNNGGYPGSDLCRIAPLAGRLAGIRRRVITVNSMPWPREHSQPQVQAIADTLVWRNVDAVLGPARIVGRRLTEMRGMPSSLFRYVPGGVEPPGSDHDAAGLRERLLAGRRLLVGMVSATNDREKGHDVLVEALGQTEDAAGVIVGPEPDAGVTKRIHELGLNERLSLEGTRRPADAYYHAFDVLVVPSTDYECLPVVILEAMAAGKPVIASRLAGIPEAVEDGSTGWLFAPGSVAELVERIDHCLQSPAVLGEVGEAGRRRWAEKFSTQSMWHAYMDSVPAESPEVHSSR